MKVGARRRATDTERAEYAAREPAPVYPLWGYVGGLDGTALEVEDLRGSWSKPDPLFEIMAPDGHHFDSHGTHSILCGNLAAVTDEAGDTGLQACRGSGMECDRD